MGVVALLVCTACGVEFAGTDRGAGASANVGSGGGGQGGDDDGHGQVGGGDASRCDAAEMCVAAAEVYVLRLAEGTPCPDGWREASSVAPTMQLGCSACTCAAPPPGSCAPSTVEGYSDATCGSWAGDVTSAHGACYDYQGAPLSFSLPAAVPSGASCEPSSVEPLPLAAEKLCMLTRPMGRACGDGFACIPSGIGTLCHPAAAATDCGAAYATSATLAAVLGDDRACGCSCGSSSGQVCAGASVTVFSSNSCGNVTEVVPADGMCHAIAGGSGSLMQDAGSWTGGSCPPQPTETGSIAFGELLTLCCE